MKKKNSKKKHSIPTIPFRRKREQRTDYKKRMALLKSNSARLVIRRFNKNIVAQLVKYHDDGDNVLLTVHSSSLIKLGKKSVSGNCSESYLTGMLVAKKAKELKIEGAVVDIGLHTSTKGSRIYSLIKGAVDGGLKINVDKVLFPSEEKIKGKNPAEFEKIKQAILK
mgnify:CR=1 FL=1